MMYDVRYATFPHLKGFRLPWLPLSKDVYVIHFLRSAFESIKGISIENVRFNKSSGCFCIVTDIQAKLIGFNVDIYDA